MGDQGLHFGPLTVGLAAKHHSAGCSLPPHLGHHGGITQEETSAWGHQD